MRNRTRVVLCAITALLALPTVPTQAFSSFAKWAFPSVTFYFNPQNADVTTNAAEAALLVGMNAWNNEGHSRFAFFYGGRVSDTGISNDGRNVVLFRNDSSPGGGNTIAATYTWTVAGNLVDADIIFWDGAFTFVAGNQPCNGGIYIDDIAAHEFGHALGLNHSPVADATMLSGYPYCSMDSRTLAADDIAGVQALYGVAGAPANTAPTITITSPASGISVTTGTALTFSGTAFDTQDGNLSAGIRWTSSLDGLLGTSASLARILSPGIHVVTASVTDSGNLTASATSSVTVVVPPPAPAPPAGTNVALASAGATASASSTYGPAWGPGGWAAAGAINGDRTGANWGSGGGWNDATPNSYPDWLEIDFAASYTIGQVNVFTAQDQWAAPSPPTPTQTFSLYGLRDFEVQYWTGVAWTTIPGTTVTNNTLVWRTLTFTPVITQKIRILATRGADGYSRLTEVEAFTTDAVVTPPPAGTNVALASAGATASASSTYGPAWGPGGWAAAGAINGDRTGANWGSGGGWNDATPNSYPDWLEIDFAASYTIGQVNVFTAQDQWAAPSPPTPTQTFSLYGLRDFEVQYWTGVAWTTIPGTTVTNNTLVWRTLTFTPVITQKIRILATRGADGYSRLTEVEAFTTDAVVTPPPAGTNVALASAGATASASSTYGPAWGPGGWAAAGAINGDRTGANWGSGGGWNDATPNSYPDWLEIDFAASYTIGQVNVFTAQDQWAAPSPPTPTQTFSLYGLRDFEVQYWTGVAWTTIPGTTVTNNTLVWRTLTFTPVITQKIRILATRGADGYSRLTEVEAFTTDAVVTPPPAGTNVALASAGATASASSTYGPAWGPGGWAAAGAINGDRTGANWGSGGGWNDATPNSYPDWLEIDFAASYTIGQVNVFTAQDQWAAPSPPTPTQTFSLYGLRDFEVQYWTGAAWTTIPGTTVTNNTLVWRTLTFTPVITQKIRVLSTATADGYSRITEVEALVAGTDSSPVNYTYQVVTQYPHDTAAFTQGLELANNVFYESTGLNGASSLRRVNLQNGAVLQMINVPAQYFAEGMTLFQGKIFQLTWQSGVAFVYDPATFVQTGQFSYAGEGWGLTHDAQNLIMSDGTNQIRFIDPATFQTVRTISVMNGQTPVTQLNELEYINGEIYANVWLSDLVVRINPTTGQVTGVINLQGLLAPGTSADVLNGIAYNAANGHLLVTGKYWPWVFEITLQQTN